MLKIVGAASLALGMLGSSGTAFAAAHNPLIVWQGSATITGLTAGCGTTGFVVGDLLHSVFRARLDPAEPVSGITLISGRSAGSFFQASGVNDQMQGTGNWSGAWMSGRVTSGAGPKAGAFNFKIKPASITATTPAVTITGRLTNFQNTVGCTLNFVGSYNLRP